jgi:LacI family transcriptional regulator
MWLRKPGMTDARFSEILRNREIYGIVFAPLPPGGGEIQLAWANFTCGAIGYSPIGPEIHRGSNDQFKSMRIAIEELTKLGYKRIGLAITAESDRRVRRQWFAGMLVYQQDIAPELRVPPLLAEKEFKSAFRAWYLEHRPDAVVSLTEQCLYVLSDLEVRVPEDVGFAHLALTGAEHDYAGINQNSELVGAAVLDLVDASLRRNERGLPAQQKTVLISGHWVPGPTLRVVRSEASMAALVASGNPPLSS